MAYTIQIISGGLEKQHKILNYLNERMAKENVFSAKLTPYQDTKGFCCIKIKPVRLVKAKLYCGNHPGPCELNGQPKKTTKYLEWNDWIKFHGLVNRVLNRFKCNANVWITPQDTNGKFYMRLGLRPRIRYDYESTFNSYGREVRVWNNGTPDQFEGYND